MALSAREFTKRLLASKTIELDRLKKFLDGIPKEEMPSDGEALARKLVSAQLLTAYQAQIIYQNEKARLTLGNYVILDKIGKGGMGMVLKALHRRMERVVALKVLNPSVTKTQKAVDRFQREVRAAARLNHPNIVAAYDADQDGKTYFFVMQYVDGQDLSSIVKKKGPLEINAAVDCALQTARGLKYAHEQGVVHRDVKPHNLLLDVNGEVKILDMGLALVEEPAEANKAELTNTGVVMGTVDYMAPEQAVDSHSADARSDIYSLGITLWYMLTGRAAYDGDSLMAKLLAHRDQPIPSLCQAREGVSPALEAVFYKMVAKRPEDRFQSMAEVEAELERVSKPGAVPVVAANVASQESQFNDFLANLDVEAAHAGKAIVERVSRKKGRRSDTSRSSGTITLGDSMSDTDSESRISRSGMDSVFTRTRTVWYRNWQLIVSLAGATGVVVLALFLVWMATARGDVLIKSYDPSIKVGIKRDGELIDSFTVAERRGKTPYRPGNFQIIIMEDREDEVSIINKNFRLKRNEPVIVEIMPK